MPTRAAAGATFDLTGSIHTAFQSSSSQTLCSELPTDWVVNGTPTCALSDNSACALTSDTDAASSHTAKSGYVWSCWTHAATVNSGVSGTFAFNITVGAAGTYVPQIEFDGGGFGPGGTTRSIAIDALPTFDANLELFADSAAPNAWLTADGSNFYVLENYDFSVLQGATVPSHLGSITAVEGAFTTDVTFGGGRFVAIGLDNQGNVGHAWWSTDGVTWTQSTHVFSGLFAIEYVKASNRFVAIGNAPAIYVSTDGDTWTDIPTDPEGPIQFQSIAASATQIVALSPGNGYVVLTGETLVTGTLKVNGMLPNTVAYAPGSGFVFSIVDAVLVSADLTSGTTFPTSASANDTTVVGARDFVYADSGSQLFRVTPTALVEIGRTTGDPLSAVAWNDTRTLVLSGGLGGAILHVDHPRLAATVNGNIVTVRNSGTGNLYLVAPTLSGGLTASGCEPGVVAADTTCTYVLAGTSAGTITVNSNGIIDPSTITLNVDLSTPPPGGNDGGTGTDGGTDGGTSTGTKKDGGCSATPTSLYAVLFGAFMLFQVSRRGRRPLS